MPAWQDPEIQDGRETGFVFSLMEILLLVFLYHYVGFLRELVKNPIMFSQFLYIFCPRRAKCTFSPCTGKCWEKKMYKTSVQEAASPPLQSLLAADRQAARSHWKLQHKEKKLTGTHSGVPTDYFCSCQPAPSQDNKEDMLLLEAPYTPLRFADEAFVITVSNSFFFSNWFIDILEYKKVRILWK